MKMSSVLIGAFVLMALVKVAAASAEKPSLEDCQYIQDRIDYYSDLRRKGGTNSQMEYWKREWVYRKSK